MDSPLDLTFADGAGKGLQGLKAFRTQSIVLAWFQNNRSHFSIANTATEFPIFAVLCIVTIPSPFDLAPEQLRELGDQVFLHIVVNSLEYPSRKYHIED